MSSTPTSSSTDLERKLPEKVGIQESAAANPEYDRYLALHEQMQGEGKKKLIRKRE